MNNNENLIGCIIGSALGDAIGELRFYESNIEEAVAKRSELKYTDDTAMSIGIMESIIENNGLDTEALGRRFSLNYNLEPWRGYAGGPPSVFALVEAEHISFPEACKVVSLRTYGNPDGSKGNGSSMRIAPIGAIYFDSEQLYEIVEKSCRPTHIHPEAIDCSAILAKSISLAIKNTEPDHGSFIEELINMSKMDTVKRRLSEVRCMIDSNQDRRTVFLKTGMGGLEAINSVPYAIYSFLTNNNSYKECLTCATFGGDVDTIGAMAGAISGAYLGIEGIPAEWIKKLENLNYIIEKCKRLITQEIL